MLDLLRNRSRRLRYFEQPFLNASKLEEAEFHPDDVRDIQTKQVLVSLEDGEDLNDKNSVVCVEIPAGQVLYRGSRRCSTKKEELAHEEGEWFASARTALDYATSKDTPSTAGYLCEYETTKNIILLLMTTKNLLTLTQMHPELKSDILKAYPSLREEFHGTFSRIIFGPWTPPGDYTMPTRNSYLDSDLALVQKLLPIFDRSEIDGYYAEEMWMSNGKSGYFQDEIFLCQPFDVLKFIQAFATLPPRPRGAQITTRDHRRSLTPDRLRHTSGRGELLDNLTGPADIEVLMAEARRRRQEVQQYSQSRSPRHIPGSSRMKSERHSRSRSPRRTRDE